MTDNLNPKGKEDTPEDGFETMGDNKLSKMLDRAFELVAQRSPEEEEDDIFPYYRYADPAYEYDMFYDTECEQAQVHNSTEMLELMKELEDKYRSEVKVEQIGQSLGLYVPENSIPIHALHMFATEEPERTAFFVAGHHPERSGPETVYLLAKRLLESYHKGNENVKDYRRNTHCVFVTHMNPDLYSPNHALPDMTPKEHSLYVDTAYSWSGRPRGSYDNVYIWDTNPEDPKHNSFPGTKERIQDNIDDIIDLYGPPHLVVDYHEWMADEYFLMECKPNSPIRPEDVFYIYAMLEQYFEVAEKSVLAQIGKSKECILRRREILNRMEFDTGNFTDYMAFKGAHAFVVEAPSWTSPYDLSQRVMGNLIATECMIARHCSNTD